MLVIGLTGGVGSGKSTVSQILEQEYGAFLIDTDSIGHEVKQPGREAYEPILELFGKEILDENGWIDKGKLAERVFVSEPLLQKLNDLTHPAVIREVERRILKKRQEGDCSYVVVETALLIESGLNRCCDVIWYVYAAEDIRRKRLRQSRGYSEERIQAVLDRQKTDDEFRQVADVVIENSGEREETRRQIHHYMEQRQKHPKNPSQDGSGSRNQEKPGRGERNGVM